MFQVALKELREEHHLSQAALAKMLGISQSTVGMWESGRNKPTYAMLTRLAALFQVSVDRLAQEDAMLNSESVLYRTGESGESVQPITIVMPDDSMEPVILAQDSLTVMPQAELTPGKLAAFYYQGRLLVRKIVAVEQGVAAQAYNPRIAPLYFSDARRTELGICVIGVVVDLHRRLS